MLSINKHTIYANICCINKYATSMHGSLFIRVGGIGGQPEDISQSIYNGNGAVVKLL